MDRDEKIAEINRHGGLAAWLLCDDVNCPCVKQAPEKDLRGGFDE